MPPARGVGRVLPLRKEMQQGGRFDVGEHPVVEFPGHFVEAIEEKNLEVLDGTITAGRDGALGKDAEPRRNPASAWDCGTDRYTHATAGVRPRPACFCPG